jgi:hypothetical protein
MPSVILWRWACKYETMVARFASAGMLDRASTCTTMAASDLQEFDCLL